MKSRPSKVELREAGSLLRSGAGASREDEAFKEAGSSREPGEAGEAEEASSGLTGVVPAAEDSASDVDVCRVSEVVVSDGSGDDFLEPKGHNDRLREAPERVAKTVEAPRAPTPLECMEGRGPGDAVGSNRDTDGRAVPRIIGAFRLWLDNWEKFRDSRGLRVYREFISIDIPQRHMKPHRI